MRLPAGTRLKNYEIMAAIGAGGMGEVYRARDMKLGRDVAIKVLPEQTATDTEHARRFEQEARAASALNHPNIITIYEIDTHDGAPYIVMEYVVGRTLREMLRKGALPQREMIRYAQQLAAGLAKAHEAGIVHRDLKPENIVVTNEGHVKILDFGLAKLLPAHEGEGSEVPTAPKGETIPGTVMGSLGYMSPEQAKGHSVDFRSDQFSLGAVVYEMAAGSPAFKRSTAAETFSALLRDNPPPLGHDVPTHVADVVRRCLSKSPEERYASTRAVVEDLAEPAPGTKNSPRLRSIAILPLRDLNPTAGESYFADGMTEAITTELAKIRDLKVISRTSAMRFKGTDKPLPMVARELGVEAIVEGSVLRAGGRVRISGQLIEAATDQHLWAESYERDVSDILSLQSDVARAVALEVRARLTADELSRLSGRPKVDPRAHEAYTRGRYFYDRWDFPSANENLRRAIEIDPDSALSHSALALAQSVSCVFGFGRPDVMAPAAKASALKALALDGSLGEARCALATVRMVFDWDWPRAEADFREARVLAPNIVDVLLGSSFYFALMGRHDEAIASGAAAWDIDPLTATTASHLGFLLFLARRYDDSIDQVGRCLEIGQELHFPHMTRSWISAKRNAPDDVARDVGAALRKMPREDPYALGTCGWALAKAGFHDRARELLGRLDGLTGQWVDPSWAALIYEGLGDIETALEKWHLAYEERSPNMLYLSNHPLLEDLRGVPEFEALRERMKFPGTE